MNPLPSAIFLDRDGTLIEDAHYLSKPKQVKLLPGVAEAIARINAAMIPAIVITNQSGIGRGIFTVADHDLVTARIDELLGEQGGRIDASYYCPHHPDEGCECRKPGLLLFHQASADHAIDLTRALYVGDRMRDVEPGIALRGQGVLVPSSETPPGDWLAATTRARVAPSLAVALNWYLCTN